MHWSVTETAVLPHTFRRWKINKRQTEREASGKKIKHKKKQSSLTFRTCRQVFSVPGKIHIKHLAGVSFQCRVEPRVLVVGVGRALLLDRGRHIGGCGFPAGLAGSSGCSCRAAGFTCSVPLLWLAIFVLFVSVECVICKEEENERNAWLGLIECSCGGFNRNANCVLRSMFLMQFNCLSG